MAIVKKETNFFILALIIYDDVFDTYHETKLAIGYSGAYWPPQIRLLKPDFLLSKHDIPADIDPPE